MNDRIDESFSALLDDEASEVDVQRLLKALERDPGLLERWHRLSCAQGALRGDCLVDRVGVPARLSGQAPVKPVRRRHWWGRAGLAASVALIVMVAVRWPLSVPDAPDPGVAEGSLVTARASFEARQRLNSYLRQHAEAASYNSGHVVVPYLPRWEAGE